MHDVNMSPKPTPTGDDTPPGSGAIDTPPTPPEAEAIDNPPTMPEPDTTI